MKNKEQPLADYKSPFDDVSSVQECEGSDVSKVGIEQGDRSSVSSPTVFREKSAFFYSLAFPAFGTCFFWDALVSSRWYSLPLFLLFYGPSAFFGLRYLFSRSLR